VDRFARNKAFFYFTFEGVRRPNEVTLTQVVPPDAWRGGDLSSLSTALRNPFSGGTFAGNRLPLNPVVGEDSRLVLSQTESVDRRRNQRAELRRQRTRRLHGRWMGWPCRSHTLAGRRRSLAGSPGRTWTM
jgi:hypothetical protein